jgi:predicted acyl esterase
MVEGARTPLFLTQGFLETNTRPDGAFDFFNLLAGPNQRAWFGQFDHVRGWEREPSKKKRRYLMGRDTFVAEMMRFFDHHLKGIRSKVVDPTIEVQDARGRYRAEPSWPPPDARAMWTELGGGSYVDDGLGSAQSAEGIWSISQKLAHDVWLAGEPIVKVTLDAVPRSNVVAHLYDIGPTGRAVLISRGAHLVRGVMEQDVKVDLYGQDWPVAKGHRIGVRISDADSWWLHVPTTTTVEVLSAQIGLPFLTYERVSFLEGTKTTRLKGHLQGGFDLSDDLIAGAERHFHLPPPLRQRAN